MSTPQKKESHRSPEPQKGARSPPTSHGVDEEYTFRPEISAFGQEYVREETIAERSRIVAEEKKRKIDALAKELDEEELKKLPFRPTLETKYKLKAKPEGFMKRMQQSLSRQSERIARLRQEREEAQEATFSPRISTYSKALPRSEPVHERLFRLSQTPRGGPEGSEHSMSMEDPGYDPTTGQELYHPRIKKTPSSSTEKAEDVSLSLYQDAIDRDLRRQILLRSLRTVERSQRSKSALRPETREYIEKRATRELQGAFSHVDQDKDGWIAYEELAQALVVLGMFPRHISPKSPGLSSSMEEGGDESFATEMSDTARSPEEIRALEVLWDTLTMLDQERLEKENGMDQDEAAAEHDGVVSRDVFMYVVGAMMNDAAHPPRGLEEVAHALAPFTVNKLVYRETSTAPLSSPVGHSFKRGKTGEMSGDLPFHPKICPMSEELAGTRGGDIAKILERRHSEAKKNIAARKQILETERMKECTFTPKLAESSEEYLSERKVSYSDPSQIQRLFEEERQRKEELRKRIESEKQEKMLAECTFKPDISKSKGFRLHSSSGMKPRGFQKAISRMRSKQTGRKRDVFEESLRAEDGSYTPAVASPSPKKKKPTKVKPFTFALDQRKRTKPLLYIDVNLGLGRTGRIGIHEGDDPAELAKSFASTYKLDDVLTHRLTELLQQHVEQLIPQEKATKEEMGEERFGGDGGDLHEHDDHDGSGEMGGSYLDDERADVETDEIQDYPSYEEDSHYRHDDVTDDVNEQGTEGDVDGGDGYNEYEEYDTMEDGGGEVYEGDDIPDIDDMLAQYEEVTRGHDRAISGE
eukprot:TRINITY_DN81028_c0_g1_i1.p1 TRINITY_DN81028_c0_g1~~TRINITY_DN81028_c0_g1_i1.p1  ORF type:complete len:812 (+),score=258.94 TRINITY_DN81028_c0_g1_i1:288-2723(+)